MALHWTERSSAQVRIGEELRQRGWTLFGYSEDQSDARSDYYHPASWYGIATNEKCPGVVVGVIATDYAGRTGTTGTWPTYQPTPKGRAWHVEKDGRVVRTGTGLSACAAYTHETWQRAVRRTCDDIERAAADATSAPTTTTTTNNNNPAQTSSSAGDLTVAVTHDQNWTWVQIEPRISREDYLRFAAHFGARWSKKRKQVYITRPVEAAEILAFLAPNTPDDDHQVEAVAPRPAASADDGQQDLLRSVIGLSSGTLASLSGLCAYADIDAWQAQWVAWLQENPGPAKETWQGAFHRWQAAIADPAPVEAVPAPEEDAAPAPKATPVEAAPKKAKKAKTAQAALAQPVQLSLF